MSIVATISEDEATGEVAGWYQDDVEKLGHVASYTKVMTLNPEAFAAFQALIRSVAKPLGLRRFELVTLAAARGLRSRHCLVAHARKSLGAFDEQQLMRIAHDYHDAGLSEAEVAMMEFAEKLSVASAEMTDTDSLRLREHGFSDREIVDITITAAARNYYSRALQALGVELDASPDLSLELRQAMLAAT
jgi:uncharacterized peroxidase-related enzyme